MLYKSGHLEVAPDVRSVPLGCKRKRGRPKKIPNCLFRSPVRSTNEDVVHVEQLPDDDDLAVIDYAMPESSDLPKKTTRKKKRKASEDREPLDPLDEESVDASPIQVLHSQTKAQAGLGFSKPPKKRLRTANVSSGPSDVSQAVPGPAVSRPVPSGSSDVSQAVPGPSVSRPVPSGPSDVSQVVHRPKSVVCKKKSGSCKHEIVFDQHYNKAAWNKYADYVKSAKSTTVIDEDYIP